MLRAQVVLSLFDPLATLCCFAQGDVLPRWMDSTTTRVRSEKKREFEKYLRELIAAHRKAGTLSFQTFETFAGETAEYTTLAPVIMFGDLDGPSALTRVLGEKGRELLSRKIARCYTAQSSQYATPHSELEIHNATAPMATYWVVTHSLVAPGKLSEYLTWLRDDYCPALKKAGVARFQVLQPVFGAAGGEIVTMRMLKNLAEIDSGAVLSKALSEEQARAIVARAVPLVSSSNTTIVRLRTDLSYSADAPLKLQSVAVGFGRPN